MDILSPSLRWTWAWVNSGSWWWTGRPGVLRFMGSQRVGHDWATELTKTAKVCFYWKLPVFWLHIHYRLTVCSAGQSCSQTWATEQPLWKCCPEGMCTRNSLARTNHMAPPKHKGIRKYNMIIRPETSQPEIFGEQHWWPNEHKDTRAHTPQLKTYTHTGEHWGL